MAADELRQLIEELRTLDERRGYLRARLDRLLDDATAAVVTPTRRGVAQGANGTTPGLRLFIEQTCARRELDILKVGRPELRDDVVARYPGVPKGVLMSRLSNTLKDLKTAAAKDVGPRPVRK